MKCMKHDCVAKGVITEDVILMGKRMTVTMCQLHYELVRDVKEEEALKREQAAERRRWGDPQRFVR